MLDLDEVLAVGPDRLISSRDHDDLLAVTEELCMPSRRHDDRRLPITPGRMASRRRGGRARGRTHRRLGRRAVRSSQGDWLSESQGMGSYLDQMEDFSRRMGALSGRFEVAEGWQRHLHFGYATEDADPIRDLLGDRVTANPRLR